MGTSSATPAPAAAGGTPAAADGTASASPSVAAKHQFSGRRYLVLAAVLVLSLALILFTQQMKLWVNPESTPISALTLGGLASLWLFSIAGLVISDLFALSGWPVVRDFPVLGWVALVSLFSCLAWSGFVAAIGAVDFLSITTPILAFAGISVADRLVDLSKTSWKVAIVAVFVFVGTYTSSALLAQLGLTLSGS